MQFYLLLLDGFVLVLRDSGSADVSQVWARATSTVGTALETKAWAVDVPITVQGIQVSPVCLNSVPQECFYDEGLFAEK